MGRGCGCWGLAPGTQLGMKEERRSREEEIERFPLLLWWMLIPLPVLDGGGERDPSR